MTGLKPASFSTEGGTVEFARDLDAQEAAETIAALRAEIATLRQELAALKPAEKPTESPEFAAMRSEVAAVRREKLDHDLEKLIDQGRILPVFKSDLLAFAAGLDMAGTVSFSMERIPRNATGSWAISRKSRRWFPSGPSIW